MYIETKTGISGQEDMQASKQARNGCIDRSFLFFIPALHLGLLNLRHQ